MFARNKGHSVLLPGRRYSKKEHSQRIVSDKICRWWSLEKSSPLQSLQPKTQVNCKTCKVHVHDKCYKLQMTNSTTSPNFPRGLIIKNVKTWFAVVFLFCDGKDSLWLYMLQKDCKNTCFLVAFPFVTETVYFWSFITSSFMQVGPFMLSYLNHQNLWDSSKIFKKWLVILTQRRIWMEQTKAFRKKNKRLGFGQIRVKKCPGRPEVTPSLFHPLESLELLSVCSWFQVKRN